MIQKHFLQRTNSNSWLYLLRRLRLWRYKREKPKVKVNRVTGPNVWWLSVMKANDFSFSSVLKFVWVNLWIAITRYIVRRGGGQSSRDLDGIDTLSQASQPGSFGTKLNQFHHHYFWEGGNGRRPLLGVWILNQRYKTNNLIESVKWNLLFNCLRHRHVQCDLKILLYTLYFLWSWDHEKTPRKVLIEKVRSKWRATQNCLFQTPPGNWKRLCLSAKPNISLQKLLETVLLMLLLT